MNNFNNPHNGGYAKRQLNNYSDMNNSYNNKLLPYNGQGDYNDFCYNNNGNNYNNTNRFDINNYRPDYNKNNNNRNMDYDYGANRNTNKFDFNTNRDINKQDYKRFDNNRFDNNRFDYDFNNNVRSDFYEKKQSEIKKGLDYDNKNNQSFGYNNFDKRYEQNNSINNNDYYNNANNYDNYNNYNNQGYYDNHEEYNKTDEIAENIDNNGLEQKEAKKKIITKIIFIINLIAFSACAIYLGNYYYNSNKVKGKQSDLSDLIDQTVTTEEGQDRYASIRDKYPNLVGRLRFHNYNDIIDLPVMQTKDDPMYYLYRDQDGEDSKWGTPFLDYRCDLQKPTANFMIYAHNMKDLTQFGSLKNYKNKSYWNKYPKIEFESMYEERMEYEIIASFYTQIYPSTKTDVFKYYKFFDALVPEEFDDYITNIIKIANYKTGVTASFGEQLITLSTCDSSKHVDDGRFVVVAKKLSEKSESSDSIDDFVDVIEQTPKPVSTAKPTKEPAKTPKPTKEPVAEATKEPVVTQTPEPTLQPTVEPQPTEAAPPPEEIIPTEEPERQDNPPDTQPTEAPGNDRPWWENFY